MSNLDEDLKAELRAVAEEAADAARAETLRHFRVAGLSAESKRADFDPVAFLQAVGPKIHFVHLRNTRRVGPASGAMTSFYESEHLGGDTDMVATIGALLSEQTRRRAEGRADWQIPMRPDHGQAMLDDLTRNSMPGYPLIGRMRGLAELRGVMMALG